MAIAVVYEQHKPHAMAFAVNDRRAQSMTISNYFADRHAMFKIQSTSPKKFRVRPAFAALPPNARVAVSILLSPQVCRRIYRFGCIKRRRASKSC